MATKLIVLVGLLGIIIWSVITTLPDGKLHLWVCDVGQGDAMMIRTPKGADLVLDGGPDNSVLECLSRSMPFYDRTVEAIILTHPQQDHMVGLSHILRRYRVEKVLSTGEVSDSQEFKEFGELVEKEGAEVSRLAQGERIVVDGVEFDVLWPPFASGYGRGAAGNERSLVLLAKYGEFTALLPGDREIEDWGDKGNWGNMGNQGRTGVTLLKIPHHGSKTGLTREALEGLRPRLAIISVGKDNRYGHPHPEILEMLSQARLNLLRTDQDGTIEVITDGGRWEVDRGN